MGSARSPHRGGDGLYKLGWTGSQVEKRAVQEMGSQGLVPVAPSRALALPDCTGCPLQGHRKVWPTGPGQAQIAIVGEGPGFKEDLEGQPFVGPSGRELSWYCRQAGIPRNSLWITNAALCMPRPISIQVDEDSIYWSQKQAMESSIKKCKSRLYAELAVVKPKVVVVLGNESLELLTGERGIQRRHGALYRVDLQYLAGYRKEPSFKEEDITYVMPAFHPAFALRTTKWSLSPVIVQVLQKAKRIAKQGPTADAGRFVLVSPYAHKPEETIDTLEYWVHRTIEEGVEIAFDVETPRDPKGSRAAAMTVFGFAVGRWNLGIAVTILAWNNALGRYEECWTPAQKARILAIITQLMRAKMKKWAWNAYYDINVCRRELGHIEGPFGDGMHWHWCWQPDIPHTLNFVCQSVLDIEPWKARFRTLENEGKASHEDLLLYNAKDCLYTAWVIPYVKALATNAGNAHLVEPYQWQLSTLANDAYLHGLPVHAATWLGLYAKYATTAESARQVMVEELKRCSTDKEFSDHIYRQRCLKARLTAKRKGKAYKEPKRQEFKLANFNPKSEYQSSYYLFTLLQLQPTMTEGGEDGDNKRPSISYKHFLGFIGNPLVKAYCSYHENCKRLETLRSIRAHCDQDTLGGMYWRLHPGWNDTGIKGTRFVSKPNVQNVEKEMRRVFRTLPGRVWVAADAAQLEYRIAAVFAGLGEILDIFNQEPFDEDAEEWKKYDPRYDAHSLVAAEIFGDEYLKGELKLKKAIRTLVKRVVYGMFYGARPKRIRVSLLQDRRMKLSLRKYCTLERITSIYEGFEKRFRAWTRWSKREVKVTRARGYQQFPPLERRRFWPVQEIEEPKLRNTPIQLSAGDVCNLIFLQIMQRCRAESLDAHFALHGHDALYLDCKEEHAKRVCEIVNQEFDVILTSYDNQSVRIYGQAGTGRTMDKVG